ncbi:hypothetical protein OG921_17225 [Aldersonia sp. NBC_00410]|uniref:hypothetical protein n=1 Tax=Aldersonia sp. NBC_00410 TaxID=2975954 RepID=UPI002251AEBF|nr:hypothetical protein [Aldersonia sp. NBC_00410]MCX5044912.1 hypothetical protein [Aldersonia sp. NBC_00410]
MEIGSRSRNQPAPPFVVLEALTQPHRDPRRPWLELRDDEQEPRIVETAVPDRVLWASLWVKVPDALVQFDLSGADGGTDLRWTLLIRPPAPAMPTIVAMRKRLDILINHKLRSNFGQ